MLIVFHLIIIVTPSVVYVDAMSQLLVPTVHALEARRFCVRDDGAPDVVRALLRFALAALVRL